MIFQTLGLILFLYPAFLHCKLILSTNASKPVQNEGSHAEILNSSLQRFDNFTLCARYCQPEDYTIFNITNYDVRFFTFNFSVSSEISRQPNQYLFTYEQMSLLGNHHSTFSQKKGVTKKTFLPQKLPVIGWLVER